jgi:purine-binding chemotaxis protein CheW
VSIWMRGIVQFRLEGRRCAIDSAVVVEILAAVASSPLPRQPDYLAGVINVRGTIVPVLDLRARFGLPHRPMELSDQFIVVRVADRPLALWVDEVETFAPADPSTWSAPAGLIAGDRSLAGVAASADGVITIHDVAAFVAECEADAVYEAVAK